MTTPHIPVVAAPVDDITAREKRRAVIDRAKIALMNRHGMTEPEAYRWIQKSAMNNRSPMTVIAGLIIEGLVDEHLQVVTPEPVAVAMAS